MAKANLVQTADHGPISKTRLRKLVKEHGSLAGVARSLQVAPSTVRHWKYLLSKQS